MELFEEKKKKVEAEQQSSCVCTACLLESPAFGNGILSSVFAMKSREENEEFFFLHKTPFISGAI